MEDSMSLKYKDIQYKERHSHDQYIKEFVYYRSRSFRKLRKDSKFSKQLNEFIEPNNLNESTLIGFFLLFSILLFLSSTFSFINFHLETVETAIVLLFFMNQLNAKFIRCRSRMNSTAANVLFVTQEINSINADIVSRFEASVRFDGILITQTMMGLPESILAFFQLFYVLDVEYRDDNQYYFWLLIERLLSWRITDKVATHHTHYKKFLQLIEAIGSIPPFISN